MLLILVGVLFAAWRRPPMRLWVALAIAQSAFLLVTPSFFGHYGGWVAPAIALSVGGAIAVAMGVEGSVTRRSASVAGLYAVGLAGLLIVAVAPKAVGFPSPSTPFGAKAMASIIGDARCPTADNPAVLILTGRLRRVLANGCPLEVSPTDLAYDLDHELRSSRPREDRPEFQAAMRAYYGGSDAAIFIRQSGQAGLSAATWAAIRANLPVERPPADGQPCSSGHSDPAGPEAAVSPSRRGRPCQRMSASARATCATNPQPPVLTSGGMGG